MKSFLYMFLFIVFFNSSILAQESANADCIILEDENSIICKYTHKRVGYDKSVTFDWIEPNGKISRTRQMTIPAGHGSVYDFRYKKGRTHGVWTFKVADGEQEIKTNFTIE